MPKCKNMLENHERNVYFYHDGELILKMERRVAAKNIWVNMR